MREQPPHQTMKIETVDKYQPRFESRINYEGEGGCWLWTGPLNEKGYGVLSVHENGVYLSGSPHRFSYAVAIGPIPPGYQVDHLCFVRSCVNPAHLEAVTPKENIRRSDARRQGRRINPNRLKGQSKPKIKRKFQLQITGRQAGAFDDVMARIRTPRP